MVEKSEQIKKMQTRRTIREFKDVAVDQKTVEELIEVARRTATSTGLQAASIIRVTDEALKKELATVCQQDYVGRAPELWIFVVDLNRNAQILKEKGQKADLAANFDKFFQGFSDAILMAQRVATAADEMGLGSVFLGSILNDPGQTIKLLKLPEFTFPALGLAFGKPNQAPEVKPKMDMALRIFDNRYEERKGDALTSLKKYDEEMTTYYDLRMSNKRSDTFTDQVVARYLNTLPERAKILNHIRKQGFKEE